MSADNSYFVIHKAKTWSVAHGFMSPFLDDPESYISQEEHHKPTYAKSLFDKGVKFTDRKEALEYAHDQVEEDGMVVEYGVTTVNLDE
jgi:hypothetical protein